MAKVLIEFDSETGSIYCLAGEHDLYVDDTHWAFAALLIAYASAEALVIKAMERAEALPPCPTRVALALPRETPRVAPLQHAN